ncbi:MAG: T9SS type A sorting domain-containing protein [Bacteroidetes bacterium]|nr:T9SS type A sorting domain-containing protein [Bacteroidota bacterium]
MKRILYSLSTAALFLTIGAATAFTQPLPVPPSGSGTASSPYQIDSLANLYWITTHPNSWGSYFVQLANIDASSDSTWASDSGFTPIGNGSVREFTGTYDGQLHTITGLYIDRVTTNYIGMFGYATGKIENLGLVNESIKGGTFVGGLVGGANGGSIVNCYTTGSVYDSGSDGGGLVGYNVLGYISRCYSAAADSGYGKIGGLVGENDDTVSNCYALGSVSFSDSNNSTSGGLVGYNLGVILNSYSTGKVAHSLSISEQPGGLVGGSNTNTVRNSFWDETTSGITVSNGGTGETDAAMKADTTYTHLSWDFTNTWAIGGGVNSGYPYLQAIGADQSLAVQATDFLATSSAGSVTLSWVTQSEVDNAGFDILREKQGTWVMIASYTTDDSLRGLGTSSTGRSYHFTDNQVISGDSYTYKIVEVSTNGATKDLSTLSVTVNVPKTYALYQNYPNPFNPSTTIRFDLKEQSNVTLAVYNVLGQRVLEDNYGMMNAGRFNENVNMERFASGVYFYRIIARGVKGDRFVSIRKMLELK